MFGGLASLVRCKPALTCTNQCHVDRIEPVAPCACATLCYQTRFVYISHSPCACAATLPCHQNQICVYFTFPLCLCHQTRLHSPTVTIVVTLPTPSSRTPHCNVVDYLVLWICVCAVCKRFDQIIWIGLFLVSLFANGPDLPWWCLREKYKSGKS